jgi:outer membrane lipoprotein SlyB
MKNLTVKIFIAALVFISVNTHSERLENQQGIVVSEEKNYTGGKAIGGASSMIVGGAIAGGPAGSIVGGLVGIWIGSKLQKELGEGERTYIVKDESGNTKSYRSPKYSFDIGERVIISGVRIKPQNI